jgi:hypothetical protein
MPILDELAQRLDSGGNLLEIRRSIAKLMLDHLHSLLAKPGHWHHGHFTNAVAALGMNIHSIRQPTRSWLRLCLIDLEKAIECIQSNVPYLPYERHQDAITIEELITTVEVLDELAIDSALADSNLAK